MADTSMIELADLIEREAGIKLGTVQGNGERATRKGPCPWCPNSTDRFAVFVNAIPMHYHCGIHGNGCGAHGDAIQFMRDYHHIGYHEACERLDIDPGSQYSGPRSRNVPIGDTPPSDAWQTRAKEFCEAAKNTLWTDTGLAAREYLHQVRGLTDETIKHAGLGLNLMQGYQPAAEWGTEEDIWIVRGIVIPWRIEGQLWKVNIRRSDKDVAADRARGIEKPRRYSQISGGSDGLYGADTIMPGLPLVICEGEIDRLSLLPVVGKNIAVVATGSAGAGQGERWVNIVRIASPVLVTFDYDDNKAGDNASKFWREQANAIRYTPWAHDLNEMLTQGMDLVQWLRTGIELAYMEDEPVQTLHTSDQASDVPEKAIENSKKPGTIPTVKYNPDICSQCGSRSVQWFLDGGAPYCERCYQLARPQGVWI